MSHRHHKPLKDELPKPAVSARAFLTGGDSAVMKKRESQHREHKSRRHDHHRRRHDSKSGKAIPEQDGQSSTLKLPSLSSLSLSSSSAYSDEQSHELHRQYHVEQIRLAITGANRDLESQIKNLSKLIDHKEAMAIVHVKSGKEFGKFDLTRGRVQATGIFRFAYNIFAIYQVQLRL